MGSKKKIGDQSITRLLHMPNLNHASVPSEVKRKKRKSCQGPEEGSLNENPVAITQKFYDGTVFLIPEQGSLKINHTSVPSEVKQKKRKSYQGPEEGSLNENPTDHDVAITHKFYDGTVSLIPSKLKKHLDVEVSGKSSKRTGQGSLKVNDGFVTLTPSKLKGHLEGEARGKNRNPNKGAEEGSLEVSGGPATCFPYEFKGHQNGGERKDRKSRKRANEGSLKVNDGPGPVRHNRYRIIRGHGDNGDDICSLYFMQNNNWRVSVDTRYLRHEIRDRDTEAIRTIMAYLVGGGVPITVRYTAVYHQQPLGEPLVMDLDLLAAYDGQYRILNFYAWPADVLAWGVADGPKWVTVQYGAEVRWVNVREAVNLHHLKVLERNEFPNIPNGGEFSYYSGKGDPEEFEFVIDDEDDIMWNQFVRAIMKLTVHGPQP